MSRLIYTTKPLFIAIFALLLRLLVLLLVWEYPEHCISNDTESYTSIAHNLLADHGYSSCLNAPYWPDIRRPPVYPIFLSAIIAIWGQNWIAVAMVQVLLDVSSCVLICYTVRSLYGSRAGFWAGLCYAASISSVVFSLKVLSETLCVFLIAGSLYYLSNASVQSRKIKAFRFQKPEGLKLPFDNHWLSGFCWMLAVLCKPVMIVTAPCYGWWLWKRKRNLRSFVLTISLAMLPIMLWIGRNGWVSGQYTLTSIAAVNRLQYDAAGLVAALEEKSVLQVRDSLSNVAHQKAGVKADACSGNNSWIPVYQRLGDSIIAERPAYYALLHLRGALNGLIPAFDVLLEYFGYTIPGRNTLAILQEKGAIAAIKHYFLGNYWLLWIVVPIAVLWFSFLFATATGLTKWLFQKEWTAAFFWGGNAFLLLITPGMAAEPRMLLPAMPFLAVCAGYALTNKSRKPPSIP